MLRLVVDEFRHYRLNLKAARGIWARPHAATGPEPKLYSLEEAFWIDIMVADLHLEEVPIPILVRVSLAAGPALQNSRAAPTAA